MELAGIEPRSLVGASLKLLLPTLAEGANPARTLPTKGAHPLRTPGRGFIPRIVIQKSQKTYPSATASSLLGRQRPDGTSELGLVELAGIEPATS